MKVRSTSIQRLLLSALVLGFVVSAAVAATGWEGRAEAADAGAFPGEGVYLASNAVPRNTVVEIINLESGERTEATVTRRLSRPGVLARVSPALAEILGISEDERVSVRIETVSVPGISDRNDEDERALSDDPDINPQARARRPLPTEIPRKVAEVDPVEAEPEDFPEVAEHDIDDDRDAVAATEPRPSDIRDPAISIDRPRPTPEVDDDPIEEPEPIDEPDEARPAELPEMRDPREIDDVAESVPRPERDFPDIEPDVPDDPDEPDVDEEEPMADPQRVLEDLLGPPDDDEPDGPDEPDEPDTADLPMVDELSADSYYLQVSAHRSVEAAVRTVRSLEERYPLAVTEQGEGEDRLLRILVGPVNRDERGALLIDLRSMGFRDAFVRHGGQS